MIKRAWFALRDWRDRRSVVDECVGAAQITWNPRHLLYVRTYYAYCVGLFREALVGGKQPLQLVFGDYPAATGIRRIELQIEHTLVKPGGGDSAGAPVSRTPLPDGSGHYLARVVELERLLRCDLVIDYSLANHQHLLDAGGFEAYLDKSVVIAPLLFEPDFSTRERPWPVISLFSDPGSGRRQRLLDNARSAGIEIRNIKRCFDLPSLQRLYRRCRILVNVRQTDHHDTLEELRILPALLCGVLVISEDVPLRESIPYQRFVIWASFDQLPATISRVLADYAACYARVFADPALPQVLERMHQDNVTAVAGALARWLA